MAQIHVRDAERPRLNVGDSVKVAPRGGEIIAPVKIGGTVPDGSNMMDFHFREASPNQPLGTSLDPVSETSDYKICPVRLEKQGKGGW